MVDKLKPPARKNPQLRSPVATIPPAQRSRAGLAFTARAARGELMLQTCQDCGQVAYPPRDVCARCWSINLLWQPVTARGRLLAMTVLDSSTNVYFRQRMPWRIGTVVLEAGVSVVMHIHGDVNEGDLVRVIARTDKAGQGVMMALPAEDTPHMDHDPQLRELTCSPERRRVLLTDIRNPVAQALVPLLADAGAARIFTGMADPWKPDPARDEVLAHPLVTPVVLNVTDTHSVMECAASVGHKVDILINTATVVRSGGALRQPMTIARREMETNYFGLLRLLQQFAPAMKSRGADGTNSACCWSNLLSVYALSNWPAFGTNSASQSAALSLVQSARAEFVGSGVKLMNVLHGPLDDPWYEPQSPPLVAPKKLAVMTVQGLQQGLEEVVVGDIATDVVQRWREDPGLLEQELQNEQVVE